MNNPQEYKNKLQLNFFKKYGNPRRLELFTDILKNGTPLPLPVTYEDIDKDFKRWVDEELKIAFEGKELPSMVLYSNQRFAEYTQTWEFSDENNNPYLNFKTITREINPQLGEIQDGYWNIPGERYYLISRQSVLDDNGTESYLDYKMKQPICVDMSYKVSIFTNKYQLINEFNTMMLDKFKGRQAYIRPNQHFMPMVLENISDESEYNIDDRQFFGQSFTIKAYCYIIKEEDLKVEERPARYSINFGALEGKKRKPSVEITEDEIEKRDNYYYKPMTLVINYPLFNNVATFTIDTNFTLDCIESTNIHNHKIQFFINDEERYIKKVQFQENDEVKIKINRFNCNENAQLILYGYDKTVIFDNNLDLPESELDVTQKAEHIIIDVENCRNNK